MGLLALFLCCSYYNSALASTTVPDNPTTTSPDTLDLDDGTITNPYGGCPSGTTAATVNTSNWGTPTVRYGECVNTFAISYAINQALQGTGISIDKVHYSWKYIMCFNTASGGGNHFCSNSISNRVNTSTGEITDDTYWDELTVTVEVTDANGNVVKSETWNMDKWYDWNNANAHSTNEINVNGIRWQIHEDNIELYNHIDKIGTIYTPNQLGDVRFRVVGQDKGNWDGYYGPVIRDFQTWFTYRANPCNDTALYDPSCPGYADAYAQYEYDQNCAANALYDPGCPGYAQANYNAQCSADPLYDSGCPGYAQASYTQQCNADPLFDSGCNGYDEAYLAQQCAIDSHHSTECPNYYWANLEGTSALSNVAGQGSDFIEVLQSANGNAYKILKYNESEIDNGDWRAVCLTYDNGCEDAVITSVTFNQVNGVQYAFLYTQDEDGNTFVPTNGHQYYFYTETKLDDICEINSLSSTMCDGYEQAYFDAQCAANALYNESCPGYATAYFDYSCQQNALYDSNCPGYATAFLDYQCQQNPLYAETCPGYATAFYNYQCQQNPLYAETCPGYEQAFFTAQCTANALYDEGCPGYAEAFFTQQCTANALYDQECPGYAEAYYLQQCTANPLYDAGCEGHYDAQCEANALYDFLCPGYNDAYFDQQCQYNPQYDTQCPGYVEPIVETSPEDLIDDGAGTGDAIVDSIIEIPAPVINEMIIMPQPPAPEPMPAPLPVVEIVEVEVPEVTIESIELEVEAQIEVELQEVVIDEPVVEEVIIETPVVEEIESEGPDETNTEEEISSGDVEQSMDGDTGSDEDNSEGTTEDTATDEVSEGDTNEEEAVEEEAVEEEAVEEEAVEEETTEEESTEEETTEEESTEEESTEEEITEEEVEEKETETETVAKPSPKKKTKLTKAQKEKAKREKMKKIIKDKLKKLSDVMAKAATLEQQQAVQAQIAALINYVPGFNAYGQLIVPGGKMYAPDDMYEYRKKKVPENQRGLLNGLASELKHEKMVDEQYEGMIYE